MSAGDISGTTIEGGTDGTLVGNTGDRLKVDANFSAPPTVAEREFPTFTVYVTNIAPGNNKSMLSLLNASGSTVVIRLREIRIINVQTTAVTGVMNTFDLLRMTGHSAGTSITPAAHDSTDSLNVAVTARTGGTISGEVAGPLRRWKYSSDEHGVGSQDVESMDTAMQYASPLYQPISKTKPITLNANQGIHIKQTVNTTVGTFDLMFVFTQES